ncbi:B12-binding domain-containing radical SAM protein [Prosthecochloris sp. N3]|uniref:B12-binding domain-containing radical SAM protein n=1 Tax=Prosthecochloris ethylica TaxID=2743976 RepID=A0ABR9XU68_9CHLB|nr:MULTISPECIES: radical SAM protein [Prosthecochloris]MBF0587395.1 B12-binding domain-containing radical SAM protein [Prosthecochloris ethylica]MBF0637605.1 B12-binding domain-containing radical SAM protein [Prosthecochloris ethylica]NUK48632.1 B12-binding domain-containing radical SAM protein [Prosthecochloris ethylica]
MQTIIPERTRPLKFLLISPQGKLDDDSNQKPLFHMALGVLVSLTPPQHDIELVDEHFHDDINYDGEYDFVGITSRTIEATRAYEIADRFREKGKTVVLGGLHISFNPDEARVHADSIVIGEADNLWTTLLDDIANNRLKPEYNSKDFPPVKEIAPLDYGRIAKASKRVKVDGTKSIPIYVTRGCPFNCSFCVTPNFTGKQYRAQKPELLKQQIEEAKKYFFDPNGKTSKPWFMLTDENLGINKKKLWKSLDLLKECDITFSVFLSINFLEDSKTVEKLVDAGCNFVLAGLESIKQSTLEAYNKGHVNSAEKYAKIISDCRKAGLNIQCNFLFNPALDTFEDIDELVKFVKKHNVFMPIFQIITPYPGTKMYHDYKRDGLITIEDWEKYNALHLVIKSDRYEPLLFQYKVLKSYVDVYSWPSIIARTIHNPRKLINLVTSIAFRNHLRSQLDEFERQHHMTPKQLQNVN